MDGKYKDEIKNRLTEIQNRIAVAAKKSQRTPDRVQLIAVSKLQEIERIQIAHEIGINHFGENYLQEALNKIAHFSSEKLNWHFIGGLQSNKVNKIVGKFFLIHSVDSLKLAEKIDQSARALNLRQKILVQVNIGAEETKKGLGIADAKSLATAVLAMKNVELKGFMAFPPLDTVKEKTRQYFREMRNLKNEIDESLELSMGTTSDFEIAIEEGSTMVRIGEAIFGPRKEE
jgi:pyridoxal phosphate enzyme (YggS family)